jgi:integrase/recombinase XerC
MVNLLDNITFDNNLDGTRDKLILELFYSTGIRLSELIQLKETQVDLQNCTIKVLGKRNKERVIPFAGSLVQLIKNYRKVRDQEVESASHEFLFVTNKGEPCYSLMVYSVVKKYLQLFTTVEKKSPHVLRHTYATHLLNKGAEINAVKDLLGHSSLAATQVYTHNSMEKIKKAFDNAHPKA